MKILSAPVFKTGREAFDLLMKHNPLILASSTAFFATFSMPPIMVILYGTFGLYFKSVTLKSGLYNDLRDTFGQQAARQTELIARNFMSLESSPWVTIGCFLCFVFIATTLLTVVRQSIHILWGIESQPTHAIGTRFRERAEAFLLILFIGFLILVSQVLDASLLSIAAALMPDMSRQISYLVSVFLSVFLNSLWLTFLFKILPNARLDWEVAIVGGFLSSVLFNTGKQVMRKILIQENIATIFGASASMALILLFIFYSSMIIYYGACFTFCYGKNIHKAIRSSLPKEGAGISHR